jgi:hypothetical protein
VGLECTALADLTEQNHVRAAKPALNARRIEYWLAARDGLTDD